MSEDRACPHCSPRQVGPLRIDPVAARVHVASRRILLAPREYELLLALARRHGRACSRHELLREVWGPLGSVGVRTVDCHVSRLRRALDAAGADGLLTSIWGVGYRLL